MRRFRGPHTLRLIDSAVVRDEHEAGTGAFSRALGNVPTHDVENPRTQKVVYLVPVSYTHLTLPTNREV